MRKFIGTVLCLSVFVFWAKMAIAQLTLPPHVCVEMHSEQEITDVRRALRDIYPRLPMSQQNLIDQGLCFVGFYDASLRSYAYGFGPEDDRFGQRPYQYPDRTLYPKGTIKVNLTLRGLILIRYAYATANKEHIKEVEILFRHEIKHVEQYIAHPLLPLFKADECPSGVCDEKKLGATKIKLHYELEATRFGYAGVRKMTQYEWEYIVAHYSMMYKPAVLAKRCAKNNHLSADDKKVAKELLKRNYREEGVFERIHPYLTPVLARLSTCTA